MPAHCPVRPAAFVMEFIIKPLNSMVVSVRPHFFFCKMGSLGRESMMVNRYLECPTVMLLAEALQGEKANS